MNKKVLLILADGMRPDSLAACGHPLIEKMKQQSSYTLNATTVMPSVTLPCHMSLFHSVDPIRHNTTTNDYAPQVRPIGGLFEQVKKYEGKTATVFDWEQLRDLSRPGNLNFSLYVGADNEEGLYKTLRKTLKTVCEYIPEEKPDFMFFYIGVPDEEGHRKGWMTEEYLKAVYTAWDAIEKVLSILPEEYSVIITADHGGHERSHGTEMPEDMTIPVFLYGPEFEGAKELSDVSIMDLAPTVTKLLGIPANREWEGKSLL